MPKNHEARLFVLSKLSKKTNKSLGYLVFRTRDAANTFAEEKETKAVRYYLVPVITKWGPEQ